MNRLIYELKGHREKAAHTAFVVRQLIRFILVHHHAISPTVPIAALLVSNAGLLLLLVAQ